MQAIVYYCYLRIVHMIIYKYENKCDFYLHLMMHIESLCFNYIKTLWNAS
jgi:hypothetical protein